MKKNTKYNKYSETYKQVSSDTRRQLTALSLSFMAAIYVFTAQSMGNVTLLKWALVFSTLTILFEIASSFSKSQHYANWIDGRIKSIDWNKSVWGIVSEICFFLPIITFILCGLLFFMGIFGFSV